MDTGICVVMTEEDAVCLIKFLIIVLYTLLLISTLSGSRSSSELFLV